MTDLSKLAAGIWQALKERCASDPKRAVRLVMVTEADVQAALRAYLKGQSND